MLRPLPKTGEELYRHQIEQAFGDPAYAVARFAKRARAMIREGVDQLDSDRTVDGATFFAEWDAELAELETDRK